jgi:hypothetical protein
MKFETIKSNAKKIFAGSLAADWVRNVHAVPGPLAKGSRESFDAVLPFILMGQAEREELREFAEAFKASPHDWLANKAKSNDKDSTWNQMVLRARGAGLKLINDWDVRQVGKLIELFPGCVPAKYRGKPLTCYMADNEACDWMVEVKAT